MGNGALCVPDYGRSPVEDDASAEALGGGDFQAFRLSVQYLLLFMVLELFSLSDKHRRYNS